MAGYQAGSTVYQLAEQFPINWGTVSKLLERQGTPRRYRLQEGDQLSRAIDFYVVGKSFAEIGKELGVNQSTMAYALEKAGIQTRPRPDWTY